MFLRQQTFSRTQKSSFVPLRIDIRKIQHHNQPLFYKYHDPSYHIKAQEKPFLQKFLQNMDNKFPVFSPQSWFILFWNFLVMLAIISNLYEVPVAIFYTDAVHFTQFTTTVGIAINWIFFGILAIDWLIIRPSMPVQRRGYLLSKRIQIFWKYLQVQFWLDGVSTLALFIYIVSFEYTLVYLKLLFYLRAFALFKLNQWMNARLILFRLRTAIYRLIFLLLVILIFVIWLAGIFFAIDYSYYKIGPAQQNIYYPQNLWLTNSSCTTVTDPQGNTTSINLIQTYPWWVWFVYSMYWALQTISTLGYGDLTPRNPNQVLYCNVVILFTVFIFATFVNSVWDIISQARQAQNKTRQNLRTYKQFKNANQIPDKLSQKLLIYLHQKWQHDEDQQITKIVNQVLPDQLKDQLNMGYRTKIFKNIKLFQKGKETDQVTKQIKLNIWSFVDHDDYSQFVLQLVNKMYQRRFAQGQIIYNVHNKKVPYNPNSTGQYVSSKQQTLQQMQEATLYYVLRGNVIKYYPPGKYQIQKTIGDTIGQLEFISGCPKLSMARSIGFSKLSCLKRTAFLHAIKKFPYLHEKYFEYYQKAIFQKDAELMNNKCYECNGFHYFIFCPKLFPVISQIKQNLLQKIGQKGQVSRLQNRVFLTRKTYKKVQQKVFLQKIKDWQNQIDVVKDRMYYRSKMNIN